MSKKQQAQPEPQIIPGYGQVPPINVTVAAPVPARGHLSGRDGAQYVRQQRGHSFILHWVFLGMFTMYIVPIYYSVSKNHYWHILMAGYDTEPTRRFDAYQITEQELREISALADLPAVEDVIRKVTSRRGLDACSGDHAAGPRAHVREAAAEFELKELKKLQAESVGLKLDEVLDEMGIPNTGKAEPGPVPVQGIALEVIHDWPDKIRLGIKEWAVVQGMIEAGIARGLTYRA